MSRYNIYSTSDPDLDGAIGWDAPMSTFFLQIFKLSNDPECDDVPVIIMGDKYDEYKSLTQILEVAESFDFTINQHLINQLLSDMAQPYELSPIQQLIREIATQ